MKKVLLINPVKDSPAMEKYFLDRDELRIFTATTAEEGLSIHREEMVNLILTDLDLPDMGGDVLCSRIRQEKSLRKVSIIIACRDMAEDISRAKSCGANARFLKPVTQDQLTDCVGKFLDVPTRMDCRVLVRAQVYDEHGATTLFGTSRNLSVAGMLIESDDLLAVGKRIACLFFLPSARQITAVGEVVRTTRLSRTLNQYGIRFITIYPHVQAEIQKFVADNAQAA